MFKKNFKVQSSNSLSGKDKKKLIQLLKKKLIHKTVDEFFNTYEAITISKVSS